jgi:hypothetical protein
MYIPPQGNVLGGGTPETASALDEVRQKRLEAINQREKKVRAAQLDVTSMILMHRLPLSRTR